jgi:hypothetical protein
MPVWRSAASVYQGGTEQIRRLRGKRVRALVPLQLRGFDPVNDRQWHEPIGRGMVGIITNPHPNLADLLIAFDKRPGATITSLDQLLRSGSFTVIVVNDPTFKLKFEVEV